MWSISKTLDLLKGTLTPKRFSDHCVHWGELGYPTGCNKALFFLGDAKDKQDYSRLQQPLLGNVEGDGLGVDHHLEPRCDSGDKKANLRVKIKMTKGDATRLLAKCTDQKGTLEFRDVAVEFVKIPPHRIIQVSSIESVMT